ncbi:MAG: L-serine ammonia-lyase [unclassified Hahellaceae]|nr:L-serine ammonia-lyase [Hahellaceae bacterium]|tara:strand:+ start:6578 stop:7981 length:1404 start_codon:yes stop_codon:yes gene_type:complete
MLSVLDIFKIGLGPSSSHSVGPMRIGKRFVDAICERDLLNRVCRITVDLNGSLGATGLGHGSDKAIMLGLIGFEPETADPDEAEQSYQRIRRAGQLTPRAGSRINFNYDTDLRLRPEIIPTLHPNEVLLSARDADNIILLQETWYSVGGGFIATAQQLEKPAENDLIGLKQRAPHPFFSANELLKKCKMLNVSIAELMLLNEDSFRSREATEQGLDRIWQVMSECIDRGLSQTGCLPGGLEVDRRAAGLYQKLQEDARKAKLDQTPAQEPELLFDWLNVYAMAVNEENAAGGRVVTAPTNGAAGIIPSVIRHYCVSVNGSTQEAIRTFLLTAGGIGMLYKQRASISGAEMGCQGEVGVACSMAAGALAAVWGGTPAQVEHAAEIGMEHNLGLTCDPVGGLVQIPCIERNAMGAVKAVNAARLALRASHTHKVQLDQVIETMRQTGLDMSRKYKETSEGGLAVNVIEC